MPLRCGLVRVPAHHQLCTAGIGGEIIARGSTAAQEPLPPVCEKRPAQEQKGKQNGKRKDAY